MLLNKSGVWPVILVLLWNTNPSLASAKPQVQWVSPSGGDAFSSGDSILGKWTTDTAVVSPAFKLCPGDPQSSLGSRSDSTVDDGSCGSKVYPTVQQSSGTYSISLAVPNTTTEQTWHLEMSDDFDNMWSSPSFSLSSTGAKSVASAAGAQVPFSAQSQTQIPTSATVVTSTAIPQPLVNPETASAATMLATRTPPPTAAFAVPLSIVGAILLVAVFLSLKHNRKLAEERAQDVEKLVLSRKSSVASSFRSGFSRQSDIEHALNVLSKAQSQWNVKTMPVPLFMPMEAPVLRREARRSTREAYYPDQYTENHRPRQARRYHERPPSYRTAPIFSELRSPSRARSLLSSVSSGTRASSRTAVHPPSHQCFEHGRHYRSYKPSQRPSSLPVASPFQHSNECCSDGHRNSDQHSDPCYPRSRYGGSEDMECVTHSVLGDYLPDLNSPGHSPDPPKCLVPAPQRLHVRNNSAMSSRSYSEEDEDMTEVDLYGAVADSLNRARRHF
ncbi:hypothetical protein J3R30DRAFT_3696675 [Lentinula aciculospora]|uniref:Uncharacterized protein n=1 Tax=Lentinula aciculospora TaxID=153920 RepID=A0A9W9AN15_9AGAR|nr:hypothetical protein J3R30DRAFT_3696675 [Lentinula aciculospora]